MLKALFATTMLAPAAFAVAAVGSSPAMAQEEVVYNRGNDTDPSTLDHHLTSTIAEGNIMRDLYEGLVVQTASAEVVAGVAEDWEISDDGMTYTFYLRDDAKWSNGDPVTAEDFVFTFRRLQDPETAAPYANLHFIIENAEAINKGDMETSELGVTAVDDKTLEIKLNTPTPARSVPLCRITRCSSAERSLY